MVDYERNWCHFCFKGICGPKVNNWGKRFILFLTIFFIGEELLSLFTLLNTCLSSQICSEMLLRVGNTFQFFMK